MKNYLHGKISLSLQSLGIDPGTLIGFEKPRQAEHGDLTTNIAMVLAKSQKKNPRQLASDIVNSLQLDSLLVSKVEIAGPGFINFTLTPKFYRQQLGTLLSAERSFGRSNVGNGKKTQVEFVSANPTGPLTVGHGRGAVYGDTVSNLLEWTGHDVTREYYFNNAGRQMRVLGDSVRLRYLQLLGERVEFPEDYYQGEYIKDIASHLKDGFGDSLRNEPAEGKFKAQAEKEIFEDIKKTLKSLGIIHKTFFNENSLYEDGKIKEVLEEFKKRDLSYESEGAVWLKTSALGSEKDKVIVKNTGEPTYRLPDIAYHVDKFRRRFELIVDIFGSDHIATYPDVLAGVKALGYDDTKVRVLIHQFVTIMQGTEVVKMSTRKANYITLDELIAEVGPDVVRYFFLMRSMTAHLNFDLNLAKQQSDENPVYYLQYAHARICSIMRKAEEEGKKGATSPNLDLLKEQEELELIKMLLEFPETVEYCAETFEIHRLAEYLQDVATAFHKFYHNCRVVSEDSDLTHARLALCDATKAVLRNGFAVLGISAPEKM
ncbi:MAG: arginine--tRNA ligase [Bacteroidetes bacterium]|nr:arginine--tRNA ligase [Bacteroidota bacterium]MCW5894215.1 arginine--tRNA ligase [Bacteroidota bacterium]